MLQSLLAANGVCHPVHCEYKDDPTRSVTATEFTCFSVVHGLRLWAGGHVEAEERLCEIEQESESAFAARIGTARFGAGYLHASTQGFLMIYSRGLW